jgi:hypothetical protein
MGGWEGLADMPPACRAQALRVWSSAVPFCDVHPPCRHPYRATRATIKALPSAPHPARPYGLDGHTPKNLPVTGPLRSPWSLSSRLWDCVPLHLLLNNYHCSQRLVGASACLRPGTRTPAEELPLLTVYVTEGGSASVVLPVYITSFCVPK